MTEVPGELRGGYEADACPGCRTGLRASETCPIPACPCYGERGERARELAAAYRRRPSIAQGRAMTGRRNLDAEDALAALDRRAWLDLMELAGEVVEFVHRARP